MSELGNRDGETIFEPVSTGPVGSVASTGSAPPAAARSARPELAPGKWSTRALVAAVLSAIVLLGILATALLPGPDRGRGQAAGSPDPSAPPNLYTSADFVIPFQLAVPTWVAPEPSAEESQFVTWRTPDVAIRVMVPVEVHPAGAQVPSPPPLDYMSYLLSQSEAGARFTDSSLTTVGGQPATLVTATASRRLTGAVGCSEVRAAPQRCFGLRPERQLRIAVVEVGGRTLLIWLRSDRRSRFAEERQLFEQTLSTVQFR